MCQDIFDEFHFSESEDEIELEHTPEALERHRTSLANVFEISQARPVLQEIVLLSSVFPWIWNTRSWVVYGSIGPWRMLIRWRFGLQELYSYELALGSTIDKDMANHSKVDFCGQHHRRQKAKILIIDNILFCADTETGSRPVRLENRGCIAAMKTGHPSCSTNDPSFVPLYLYELQ